MRNKMRNNRVLLRFGIVLGLALIAGAAIVLYPVMVASSVLSDVRRMAGQSMSEAWLRQWAEEHRGSIRCDDSDCAAEVSVSNWLLSRLRLARPTLFATTVVLKGGKLTHVRLTLTDLNYQARHKGATTSTVVDYTEARHPGSGPTTPKLIQEPVGKPPTVTYFVTPGAERHALALAYEINVWCLARIGGCLDSQQAPEIWALRGSNKF
jgi:hypothetical protein